MDQQSVSQILYRAYQEAPYPAFAHPQTHPARVAAVARLFGLKPADVATCRVLELGCAAGWNIIPMAYAMPDAKFRGIDLSDQQVITGRKIIATLGLRNIFLEAHDFLDLNPSALGEFDYILVHGVYSWVSPRVQQQVLKICAQCLAPNGAAYISYNVLPGWSTRLSLREALLFDQHAEKTPQERVEDGFRFLDLLGSSVTSATAASTRALIAETALKIREATASDDHYFFHDILETVNSPLYFHQFVNQVQQAGLHYLADSRVSSMFPVGLAPEVEEFITKRAQNAIAVEQYLDFLNWRDFRASILCRQDAILDEKLNPSALDSLYICADWSLASGSAELSNPEPLRFLSADGAPAVADTPLVKAAYLHLMENPRICFSLDELIRAAAQRLGLENLSSTERNDLAAAILFLYMENGALELLAWTPPVSKDFPPFPAASLVARLQSHLGLEITALDHTHVSLSPFSKVLLELLDGSANYSSLADLLVEAAERGEVDLSESGLPMDLAPDRWKAELSRRVVQQLRWFISRALILK